MASVFSLLDNEEFFQKRKEIMRFLPDELIDMQCHLWQRQDQLRPPSVALLKSHPLEFFPEFAHSDFIKLRNFLFPKKRIRSFAHPPPINNMNFVKANEYLLEVADQDKSIIPCLALLKSATPQIVDQIKDERAKGVKTVAPSEMIYGRPLGRSGPLEYIDTAVLNTLNDTGKILIIHTDRSLFENRRNIDHLISMAELYPNIKIIIAHLGLSFFVTNLHFTMAATKALYAGKAKIFFETSQSPHPIFNCSPSLSKWPQMVKNDFYKVLVFGSDIPFLALPWLMTAVKDQPRSFVRPNCKYYAGKRDNKTRDKWLAEGHTLNLPYTYYSILEMHNAITLECGGNKRKINEIYERIYNGTAKFLLGLK